MIFILALFNDTVQLRRLHSIIWDGNDIINCEYVRFRRRGTNVTPLVFLLADCKYSYTEIYIYRGYVLYKVLIIFPQFSSLSTHIATFAWGTVCRLRKILCCSVGALHVSTLYFSSSSSSSGVLGMHPSGSPNLWKSEGASLELTCFNYLNR